MRYRRAFVSVGSFFFTLVKEKRRPLFASGEAVDVLRGAFRSVRSTRPFVLDAILIFTRSLALHLDIATWRRGFFHSLAAG
ncbi:MAG: hypothetical protein ABIR84_13145 [Candidatus Nitrotoga sp.]